MCSAERTDRAVRRADVRDAATIAVAVGVVGVSFGALAPSAGLSPAMTIAMSVFVFAGGAQLAVTGIIAAGGGVAAAVVAGLVLNLRHLPFGLAIASTLGRGPSRFAAAHVVTDESTAFVLARGGGTARARRAFWTLGVLKYLMWQVGTALGLVLGTVVPEPTAFGVDAAFPAAMLAMLMPMLRRADARRVGAGAAAVALIASPFAPAGVPVLAGLLGVGLAGRRAGRSPDDDGPADDRGPDAAAGSGSGSGGGLNRDRLGAGPDQGGRGLGDDGTEPDIGDGPDEGRLGADPARCGGGPGGDGAGSGVGEGPVAGRLGADPARCGGGPGGDGAEPDAGGGPDRGGRRSVGHGLTPVLARWDRIHQLMFAMPGRPS